MHIKINESSFSKEELLTIIKTSKLEAIKYIKENTGIGLKDAKDIVDSLDENPNCFDNKTIRKGTTSSFNKEKEDFSISEEKGNKGNHFIKSNHSLKKYFIFGIILIVILIAVFSNS